MQPLPRLSTPLNSPIVNYNNNNNNNNPPSSSSSSSKENCALTVLLTDEKLQAPAMVAFLCGSDCDIVTPHRDPLTLPDDAHQQEKDDHPQKPHKAQDAAWTAMRALRRKEGAVGLKHFRLLHRLGSGDIGNVFLCQLRGFGNHSYAMKIVNKEALRRRNKLQRAQAEKNILELLDHPFLPTLYAHFDASQYSCIVMDFCPGGDLHNLRHRQPNKRFPLRSARFYAAEVLVALEYLHMMGVIYRDLKPENVLVRQDGHIMLSDFDLSLKCEVIPTLTKESPQGIHQVVEQDTEPEPAVSMRCIPMSFRRKKKNQVAAGGGSCGCKVQPLELVAEPREIKSRSLVGTHEYVAPEVSSGMGHGSAVDWWAFGVFLYEMLCGTTPFKGSSNRDTISNIVSEPVKFHAPLGTDPAMEHARDLISKLLVKEPCDRLGSNRGSADIKCHPFFKGVNWPLLRSTQPPETPGFKRTRTGLQRIRKPLPHYFDYF